MVSSTALSYKAVNGARHRSAAFAVYAVARQVPASGKWSFGVRLRFLSFVLVVTAWAAVLPAASPALGQEIYTVRGVPVDATAETAVAARELAVTEGRRAAFDRLVARLVPSRDTGSLPPRTDAELGDLVLGFEIANERSSTVRYIADMTVAFDPAQVRNLFLRLGIPFAETRSLPVLVVPIVDFGGGPFLWEEPNPFRAAWSRARLPAGLVPLVVPYGDLADIRDLATNQAMTGDPAALSRIAERYGARDSVVVRAIPRFGGAVQIAVQRIGPTGFDSTLIETVEAGEGSDDRTRFEAAAARTVTLVEDAWKRENLIRSGLESRVTVTVPIDSLTRWLEIREALERTVIVPRFDVIQLTNREALLDLWVNGDAEQLRVALEQRDLQLQPGAGDYVLVERGQQPPSVEEPAAEDAPSADPASTDGLDDANVPAETVPTDPAVQPAPGAPAGGAS